MGKKVAYIITAHPDDESIFFSGLILSHTEVEWHVFCVTDGNADGNGQVRADQFKRACLKLGVTKCEILGYPDVYEKRLDIDKLSAELSKLKTPDYVYTHGVLGEYGHPHHQDVCVATYRAFKEKTEVYSVAYNCHPDQVITLDQDLYDIKTHILVDIYHAETRRFVNFIQAYWSEGFSKVSLEEVEELYSYFTLREKPELEKLKKFGWYWPYLEHNGGKVAPRPF